MHALSRLKIGTRILVGYAVVILLLIGATSVSLHGLSSSGTAIRGREVLATSGELARQAETLRSEVSRFIATSRAG
ncbi:MAG: hypothetical protein ACK5WM_18840 [Rhodospirillales bacterium]